MDCDEYIKDCDRVETIVLDKVELVEESISDRLSLATLPEGGGKMRAKKRITYRNTRDSCQYKRSLKRKLDIKAKSVVVVNLESYNNFSYIEYMLNKNFKDDDIQVYRGLNIFELCVLCRTRHLGNRINSYISTKFGQEMSSSYVLLENKFSTYLDFSLDTSMFEARILELYDNEKKMLHISQCFMMLNWSVGQNKIDFNHPYFFHSVLKYIKMHCSDMVKVSCTDPDFKMELLKHLVRVCPHITDVHYVFKKTSWIAQSKNEIERCCEIFKGLNLKALNVTGKQFSAAETLQLLRYFSELKTLNGKPVTDDVLCQLPADDKKFSENCRNDLVKSFQDDMNCKTLAEQKIASEKQSENNLLLQVQQLGL